MLSTHGPALPSKPLVPRIATSAFNCESISVAHAPVAARLESRIAPPSMQTGRFFSASSCAASSEFVKNATSVRAASWRATSATVEPESRSTVAPAGTISATAFAIFAFSFGFRVAFSKNDRSIACVVAIAPP